MTAFGGTLQDGNGTGLAINGAGTLTLTGTNNSYQRRHDDQRRRAQGGCGQCALAQFRRVGHNGGTLDVTGFAQTVNSLTVGSLGTLNLTVGNLLTTSSNSTASLAGTLNLSGTVTRAGRIDQLRLAQPRQQLQQRYAQRQPVCRGELPVGVHCQPNSSCWPRPAERPLGRSASGSWSVGPWSPSSAPNGRGQTAILNNAVAANLR